MKKYLGLIIIVIGLFAASCDRFEHTFKLVETLDLQAELFTPLQNAFDGIDSSDASAVMSFYDEDYLHNGQEKSDRESFYLSLLQQYSDLTFNVTLLAQQNITPDDTLTTVNWTLQAINAAKQVVADSTFFGEKIIKRGSSWLLYGNRDYCCPPVTYKQRVVIESFTGVFCPSCPEVDILLHSLQESYPNNLSYLAYHYNDPLDSGNLDVYGYYSAAQPTVVFQGTTKIEGNQPGNAQFYNQLAAQISDTDAKISLTNLDFAVAGTSLNGTVRLNLLDQTLDPAGLKLKYAIIDRVSNVNYFGSTTPCRNVVLAKGTQSLAASDLDNSVSFSLPLTSLPASYNNTLPNDSYLVIWVQVTPDPFNNDATIFNALEAYIPVN